MRWFKKWALPIIVCAAGKKTMRTEAGFSAVMHAALAVLLRRLYIDM